MVHNPPQLGNIISASRKEHHLTQEKLAERIGISDRSLMDLENSKRYPKFETLYALVTEMSIPPRQIFGMEESDPEAERFIEQLMSCDPSDRKIVIDTARMLMQRLKEAKGK